MVLDLDAAAAPLLADYCPDEPEPLEDDRVRLRLRVNRLGTLCRLVAGLPGRPEVVAPESARSAVADWARRAIERYDAEPPRAS